MAIQVEGLRKLYPGGKVALDGVDLEIAGTFGLLGPNGAGKSTLMRILATLVEPTAGQVWVDGIPIVEKASVRRRLGYLPQRFGFYPQLTVLESLEYMAALSQVNPGRSRLLELLERVGLAELARSRVRGLSGGMVQRLGIAAALVADPAILIVDEPTAGLDHQATLSFRSLIAGLAADRTVLLSTHVVSDVETSCSRLAVLKEGRLQFVGTPEALAATAADLVWEVEVEPVDWEAFQLRFQPIAAVREAGLIRARMLGTAPPVGYVARSISPNLEDGYVNILRRQGEGVAV